MASINDTPLTFFSKATPAQWLFVLKLYRNVFKTHAEQTRGSRKNGPADLIKLDVWFQEQLPQLVRSRKEHQLFYEELVQITKWKLLRGKFRPSLLDLVKTNTETAVKNVTKKAFRKLPNINAAITALTQLKGIGPATASAILVAYSPDNCPFMSDETMISIVEVTDYTSAEYLNYVEKIQECVDRLKKQDPDNAWTPHKIELALWTLYQIKQYNLNLLDDMPQAINEAVFNSTNCSNEALSINVDLVEEDECNQISNSDDNQVGSSLNCESEIGGLNSYSNSSLMDSNHSAALNYESSQNGLSSSNGVADVTQSDSESALNGLSSSSSRHHRNHDKKVESNQESNIVSNSESNLNHEDVSNLSSAISSNSLEDVLHKSSAVVSVEEDSSSNNVSSTNPNGISQSTSKVAKSSIATGTAYKLNSLISDNLITNGKQPSSSTTPDESGDNVISDNQINSSLIIKQHHFTNLNHIQLAQQSLQQAPPTDNADSNDLILPNTNDSSEKFSVISSSCENSNNVNSSEDSILHLSHKKRSNSSSSSSLSNLTKQSRLNNYNEALDLDNDNAVPDSESLSKRQKLIN